MKIINATVGKIGNYIVGPKYFLHQPLKLGEAAICIARDPNRPQKPYVWLFGGIEQLIDYIYVAKGDGAIDDTDFDALLTQLEVAKSKVPKKAVERLASVLGIDASELADMIGVAQVCVSAPIAGINDYSGYEPKWSSSNYHPI